jgi:hypothetical protein
MGVKKQIKENRMRDLDNVVRGLNNIQAKTDPGAHDLLTKRMRKFLKATKTTFKEAVQHEKRRKK